MARQPCLLRGKHIQNRTEHSLGAKLAHGDAHCKEHVLDFAQVPTFFEVWLPCKRNNEGNGLFCKLVFFF